MFADVLVQLGLVATFVQRFVALVKPAYKDWQYQKYVDISLSLGLSALLCVAWGVDALAVAGIVLPLPWIGAAITGLVAGTGANVLNDVLALLEMWKNQKKLDVASRKADLEYWENHKG